jgi:hypothetical protein
MSMSIELHAPGKPMAEYHYEFLLSAMTVCGIEKYSCHISIEISRKQWKNFTIWVVEM